VELGDGQSQRIDELVLRINPGLVTDLFGIEIVGDAEHPMLCTGLARVLRRVEPIHGHQGRAASNASALYHFLGHRSNGHVLDLNVARFDLTCCDLRNQVVLVIFAILGRIPLTVGVVGHEGSTVIVVMNSLRLLFGAARPAKL